MKSRFAFSFLMILWATISFATGAAPSKKLQSVEQIRDTSVAFTVNPFMENCFGSKGYPIISSAKALAEMDSENKSYLISIELKTKDQSQINLFLGDRKIALGKTPSGSFLFSLLGDQAEPRLFLAKIEIEQNGNSVIYDLNYNVAENKTTLIPLPTDEQKHRICLRSQAWIGGGLSLFSYNQTITENQASAKFQSQTFGSYQLDLRYYPNPNWGFFGSYRNAQGEIDKGTVTDIASTKFNWTILELGTQYRNYDWLKEWKSFLIYPYVRGGVQKHSIPRIAIDNNDSATFSKIDMTNAFVGVGANIFDHKRYFFDAYMNYQLPLQSTGYSIKPNLMFDGGLGVGRAFGKLAVGMYLYGQSHSLIYRESSGTDTKEGTLNFIFSNFDLRLGYLF